MVVHIISLNVYLYSKLVPRARDAAIIVTATATTIYVAAAAVLCSPRLGLALELGLGINDHLELHVAPPCIGGLLHVFIGFGHDGDEQIEQQNDHDETENYHVHTAEHRVCA